MMVLAGPASAQDYSAANPDPRIPIIWTPDQDVYLSVPLRTGLTVLLEPGEQIVQAIANDEQAFDIRIADTADSFLVFPCAPMPADLCGRHGSPQLPVCACRR